MFPTAMARRTVLLLLVLVAAPTRAERIDAIVSVVGGRVITQSDVGFEETLAEHDLTTVAPFAPGVMEPLRRLEDYRVLRSQAGDLSTFRPSDVAVAERMERFRSSWALRRDFELFLARWGMDEDALQDQLYSRMVVELYVLRNLGPEVAVGADPKAALDRYEAWMSRKRDEMPARRVGG